MNLQEVKTITRKPTIILSSVLCLSILVGGVFFLKPMQSLLNGMHVFIMQYFGFYYLYLGFALLIILFLFIFLPIGKKKLGDAAVEYSRFSWLAMLYSAGMGSGLLLRAVQEPVYYFLNPPISDAPNISEALRYSYFHWGFTPWAFYGFYGLMVAWNMYRNGENALGSSFLPQGFRKGILAFLIDFVIIFCTLIGVIASLGLGCGQFLGGLNYLMDINIPNQYLPLVVLGIILISSLSAYYGVKNSIRRLSLINIGGALLLMLFVFFNSSMLNVFKEGGIAIYEYVLATVGMNLNIGTHKAEASFLADWTYFYWAFWLAWVPFTGVFIARISKGRTVREFVLGVIVIPAIGTFIWFTVFGHTAFEQVAQLDSNPYTSIYDSLFKFLNTLPLAVLTKWITLFLVGTFLVTSIDSAILVLSNFTSPDSNPPTLRLFWGIMIGIVAIAFILIGEDALLKVASQLLVIFALPFSIIYGGLVVKFLKERF